MPASAGVVGGARRRHAGSDRPGEDSHARLGVFRRRFFLVAARRARRVRITLARYGAAVQNACFEQTDGEHLPIGSASVDVALINGIFNLNPARESIFRELARVLRPGAVAYVAELTLANPLPAKVKQSEADWFA